MKKMLFATTILASVASYAAADVSVSGDARMGVTSYDGVTNFDNRIRVTFTGSGKTAGGLEFGGSFRADNAVDAEAGNAGSVYISGAFGKIEMGDGYDLGSGDSTAVGQLASVGYEYLGSGNSISYAADGGVLGLNEDDTGASARVLYTYSANGLTLAVSSGQLTDGGNSSYGVGVAYTTGGLTVALGSGQADGTFTGVPVEYGQNTTEDASGDVSITDTSASATYVMGATTIKAIYQDKSASVVGGSAHVDVDTTATATSMGMSVSHTMDAITLTAYSLTTSIDSGDLTDGNPTVSRYGIGASYALGTGATLSAGWAAVDTATYTAAEVVGNSVVDATYTTETSNNFDIGINLSF